MTAATGRRRRFDDALLDAVLALARPEAEGGEGLAAQAIAARLGIPRNRASAAVRRLRLLGRLPAAAAPGRPGGASDHYGGAEARRAACNLCGAAFLAANRHIRFCESCRRGGLRGADGFPAQWEAVLRW